MNVEIDEVMESLTNEILSNLKALSDSKSLEEKSAYSEIVKNLTESHGVYLSFLGEMSILSGPPDEDFEDFLDEDEY